MKEKGAILIMEKMKAVGLHQYLPVDQPESLLDLQSQVLKIEIY